MTCKCGNKMELVSFVTHWCGKCGRAYRRIPEHGMEDWYIPASVEELDDAYAELSRQRPALTAVYDQTVHDRAEAWYKRAFECDVPGIETLPKTGTTCSVCGEPQYRTPSGDCCKNGHGGASPVEVIEEMELTSVSLIPAENAVDPHCKVVDPSCDTCPHGKNTVCNEMGECQITGEQMPIQGKEMEKL